MHLPELNLRNLQHTDEKNIDIGDPRGSISLQIVHSTPRTILVAGWLLQYVADIN